jgi:ABC-type sugar transport system substrate-binding protein
MRARSERPLRRLKALSIPIVVTAGALTVAACGSSSGGSGGSGNSGAPVASLSASTPSILTKLQPESQVMSSAFQFASSGAKPAKHFKIAYLAECYTENPYCVAAVNGAKQAAAQFGATVQVFDSNFSPATQAQQAQDAVNAGFDGYVLDPTAETPGCGLFKRYLQPTKAPVAIGNIPMCNDPSWSPGTVGFTGYQTVENFRTQLNHFIKLGCAGKTVCHVISVSGPLGSDLHNMWAAATNWSITQNPNARLVVPTIPANFSATIAYQKVLNLMRKDPTISVILSHDDNMSTGIVRAVQAAGKTLGKDVNIYGMGGSKIGAALVRSGQETGSIAMVPYEEGRIPVLQVLRYLIDRKATPGFANLAIAPEIQKELGGDRFLTKKNVNLWKPQD